MPASAGILVSVRAVTFSSFLRKKAIEFFIHQFTTFEYF